MQKTNVNGLIDNVSQFDIRKKHFAETYFVLFNDPEQMITLVVRYVLSNGQQEKDKVAEVWIWFKDEKNQIDFSVKQQSPLALAKISKDQFLLEIGECGITDGKAWGKVVYNNDTINWDFTLHQEGAIGIDRFPGIIKYLPFAKFYSPYCKHDLSGTLSFNDHHYSLNKIHASDGHYFGAKKAKSWNWGNCVNFKEDPDFLFEGISIIAQPFSTPALWLYFHWQGKIYNCSGMIGSFMNNKEVISTPDRWKFTAQKDGFIFEGEMWADPKDMIMHYHPLPNDQFLYTTISLQASMQLDIYQQTQAGKEKIKTLTADKTATFEITKPEQNQAVVRRYTLSNGV
jgi:hypothetical protein